MRWSERQILKGAKRTNRGFYIEGLILSHYYPFRPPFTFSGSVSKCVLVYMRMYHIQYPRGQQAASMSTIFLAHVTTLLRRWTYLPVRPDKQQQRIDGSITIKTYPVNYPSSKRLS
uniref:Uncharacterized protein n=1 Tax=Sipha flava TaxID=143950 RepID=A0A2S2QI83_9HEMI